MGITVPRPERSLMDQTKVALIWPWGLEPDRVYPLAIAYLAANIDREKFDLRVFDNAIKDRRSESEEFQADLVEFQPDVIGISGWITNREEMAALVKVIRTILPKSIVVIGGVYATGAPAQAFKVVAPDYLIVGEKPTAKKINNAKELNVNVINQEEWEKMLNKTS